MGIKKSYRYSEIEKLSDKLGRKLEISEYGSGVGEEFLVIKDTNDDQFLMSFILTGTTGTGEYIYECIYLHTKYQK